MVDRRMYCCIRSIQDLIGLNIENVIKNWSDKFYGQEFKMDAFFVF